MLQAIHRLSSLLRECSGFLITVALTTDIIELKLLPIELNLLHNQRISQLIQILLHLPSSATDLNNIVDLDASKSVTLTTSGTGITSSSPYTLSSGVLNISNVQFSSAQGPITLTATTTGYTDNDDISTSFIISNTATGTYRSLTDGTWPSGTATWERFNGSTWVSATPAANTTDLLIIRDSITSRASFASSSPYTSMAVESGGVFIAKHNSTFSSILVKNGGKFIVEDPSSRCRCIRYITRLILEAYLL